MNILINEVQIPDEMAGIIRFKSFSEITTGVFNLIERLQLQYPGSQLYYIHKDPVFTRIYLERNREIRSFGGEFIDLELVPDETCFSWNLIRNISAQIIGDVKLLGNKPYASLEFDDNKIHIIGPKENLFIHPSVSVGPGVIFDLTTGPIVIKHNVSIYPFSYIAGPASIGPGAQVTAARITQGCIVGSGSKVSGGIVQTIIGDFSNKVHEGVIRNSYIGDWVNMAGLSSTTNYNHIEAGNVKVYVSNDTFIEVEFSDLGATICDFCKVSGAALLECGTFLDIGSVLWVEKVNKYYPSFTYLDRFNKFKLDDFVQVTNKQLKRRNKSFSPRELSLLKQIYLANMQKAIINEKR